MADKPIEREWDLVKDDRGRVRNVRGRLQVKETVTKARVNFLKRGLEDEA